jgi:hypothetical protein
MEDDMTISTALVPVTNGALALPEDLVATAEEYMERASSPRTLERATP